MFYNTNMFKRLASPLIKERLQEYPAVGLLGPRQSGKTTLAKTFSKTYFDLEQEGDRLKLDLQWDELISGNNLIILDEAQSWPSLFQRLRGAIDAKRKTMGRFLILGSIAPTLMKNVSEPLAGRFAICELSPFWLNELSKVNSDSLWLRGGFPDGGVLKNKQFPTWQQNYLRLLAQRDLPLWGLPAKPQVTERLFRMLAAYQGQIWNASEIGKSLGLSYHTINSYIDYLQNTYLITLLPPYFKNLKKRVTKRPKVYWQDTGLLHSLLKINSQNDLLSQPWVGSSWEGWAIHQILFCLKAKGESFEAYYFRTSDDYEIDLVVEFSKGLWAFEIKLTSTPNSQDLQKLEKTAHLIKANKQILISKTNTPFQNTSSVSTNLTGALSLLLEKPG